MRPLPSLRGPRTETSGDGYSKKERREREWKAAEVKRASEMRKIEEDLRQTEAQSQEQRHILENLSADYEHETEGATIVRWSWPIWQCSDERPSLDAKWGWFSARVLDGCCVEWVVRSNTSTGIVGERIAYGVNCMDADLKSRVETKALNLAGHLAHGSRHSAKRAAVSDPLESVDSILAAIGRRRKV
jgi:hypothetical protein